MSERINPASIWIYEDAEQELTDPQWDYIQKHYGFRERYMGSELLEAISARPDMKKESKG